MRTNLLIITVFLTLVALVVSKCPTQAQAATWSPSPPISCPGGIEVPLAKGYAADGVITCKCAVASDQDTKTPPGDTYPDEVNYTWSAKRNGVDVGTWPSGNTGREVT